MRRYFSSFLLALFCICGSSMLFAQSTTGTILGQVTDPSGSAIAKAHVTVTDTLTGESHSMDANEQGQYVLPNLPVGVYRVEAQSTGFKHTVRDGLILTVNQEARADLALVVGGTNESVEVHADSVQVNTYTPDLGQLVDSKAVADLPLNGRNVYSLLVALPGTSRINAQTVPSRDNNTFSVNGGRATTNSCFIDGGFNNDIWRNQCSTPPNPDSILEFRLLSSNSDVEFGRMPGAFMSIITKSGTNSFHGSAFEFFRNNALDSKTFFESSVTPLKQNQYGFTAGGPVVRNKLFLFGSWEEMKQRTATNLNSIAVPTAAERNGNFSGDAIKPIDPTTGQPFPNGQIPSARIDKVASAIANAIPVGNNPDGTYTATAGTPVNEWQYLLKGDYQFTDKQKFTVSWFQMNTAQANPFAYFNQFPGFGQRVDGVQQHNLVINHTWTATNTLINEARFNLMRRDTPWNIVDGKTLADYGSAFHQGGLQDDNKPVPFRLQINGRFSTGAWDANGHDHSIGGSDSVTWIKGKHNLKLGTFVMYGWYAENGASAGGGHIFEGGDLTGNALADFMLGYSTSFTEDSGDHPDESAKYWHSYVQDTWQITPRLTLTAGVRYELTTPLVWTTNFIPSFAKGVQSKVYPNAPAGLLFYGDQGVTRAGRKTDFNNFAPRLGIAFDPFGNGKTSIRAGYGVYYLSAYGDGLRAPQPFVLTTVINGDTSLVNPWVNFPGGDPYPFTVPTGAAATFQLPMGVIHFDPNAATPYVNQMNFTVQHQLTRDTTLQVGYVGTLSRKLSSNIDQNNPVYGPGATSANVDARRPYLPGVFQSIAEYQTAFNASYNALQVVATQRASHGLSFNANYTYGRGTDLISGDAYNGSLAFTDSTNPARDRGPTDGLAHQIFAFSGTYDTPKLQKFGAVGDSLLGGWQANAIVTMHTGLPVNVTSGVDSNADGNFNDRPNQTGDPNLGGSRQAKIAEWFNYHAFTAAGPGTYGNTGRNSLFGPGYVNFDLSFFKIFTIHEAQQIQFRAEMFNAFNHTNLQNPDAGLTDSNVGRITSAYVGRIIQFGLKYSF